MKKSDFYFDLPDELIAQYPLPTRSDSRLLTYHRHSKQHGHHQFKSLVEFLEPGDLLVMNDSQVMPARVYGHKASGGKVELLVERLMERDLFLAHIKASKSPKTGTCIHLDKNWSIEIEGRDDDLFFCRVNGDAVEMLQQIGHMPLPPYIHRADEAIDLQRYQTVYAKHTGSVAAPTAGLHFDDAVLSSLKAKGVELAYSTLHVGAGTFRPVRCENIQEHKMHHERITVDAALCHAVGKARAAKKRVIAVGTTALRSLESAVMDGELQPCSKDTDIFIFPGYQFKICDGLITNFHLPESTLLMLVAAFIGYEPAMELYQVAIAQRYRFFSYGDATLLL